MLTRKLLSRTMALAMTASITVLAGCPAPTVVPSDSGSPSAMPSDSGMSSASPSATATATAMPSTSATATASATTGTASPSGTATATANSSTNPSGNTGSSSDIKDLATFNGKVYDTNGVPVEGATVSAKSIDPNVSWVGEAQQTVGGAYVFRNAPVGARIQITATKSGWTTRDRSEVLKSNLQGDPSANVFNFGSTSGGGLTGDNIYAIQDEPEVTMLKINGRQVLSAFSGDSFNGTQGMQAPTSLGTNTNGLASSMYTPSLTGVANNALEIEFTFSEPVDRESVEDALRIRSQLYTRDGDTTNNLRSFELQSLGSEDVSYTWSNDDKTLVFKTNKAVLATDDGNEFRYIIDFTDSFEDKTDKNSLARRYFRFSTSQINDFATFSVAKDSTDPRLTQINAQNGSSSDVITLTFSEDMEVLNETSPSAGLNDPTQVALNNNILRVATTNNGAAISNNNATVFGYVDVNNNLNYSYMVGRIDRGQIQYLNNLGTTTVTQNDVNKVQVLPLGFQATVDGNGNLTAANNVSPFPALGATDANVQGTTDASLRDITVDGRTVRLELNSGAFNSGDRIIVSAGRAITNNFSYGSFNRTLSTPTGALSANVVEVRDPAGNSLETGDTSTSNNIVVSNSQRAATAN